MFNGSERLVRNRGSSHRSSSQAYKRGSVSLEKCTFGMAISSSLRKYGHVDIMAVCLWICNKCVLKALVITWSTNFVFNQTPNGRRSGAKALWASRQQDVVGKHGLEVEEAEPAPAPPPPVSPETGESLPFCLWSSPALKISLYPRVGLRAS